MLLRCGFLVLSYDIQGISTGLFLYLYKSKMDIRNFCRAQLSTVSSNDEVSEPGEKRRRTLDRLDVTPITDTEEIDQETIEVIQEDTCEKRPRTLDLTPIEDTEEITVEEIDQDSSLFPWEDVDDEIEDFLGQPATVNVTQSEKVKIAQQPKAVSGPGDISRSPDDGPKQPGLKEKSHFPKSHGRRFIPEWYKKFPWIEYSACEDKVYCFTCRHFSMIDRNTMRPFVSEGFSQWKKCTGESPKNNKLSKHKNSQFHLDSATRYKAYMDSKLSGKTVTSLLNDSHRQFVKRNRDYIKIVADTLRLTAVQNIAQRGHRESNTNPDENKGNFLEILNFLKNYSEILQERLDEGPQNAKYTHHSVQNAILEILSDIILDEITEEVKEAEYFALLVDETKDLSKKEQLSFVLRYVYDCEIYEEFIGFRVAEDLTAEGLSDAIQDEMKRIGVNIQHLVGQGYDGAAVMSGKCSGVQARIRSIVPQALYVHCFAHRLNLVIVQAVKSVVPVADFFATLQMCYNFLSGSNVHSRWIAFQKNMYLNEQPVEFKTMSETRWACQVRAVSAIQSRFDCLIEFLRNLDSTDDNRERALVARSILGQIDQRFIYCMLLMYDVLLEAKGASDELQSPKLDKAADFIEALIEELETYRSEQKSADYFENSLDIATENDLNCCLNRSARQRKTSGNLENFVVLTSLGKRDTISGSSDMKRAVLYPTIDVFLNELKRRFCQENLEIFRSLSALDPISNEFLDFDRISPLAKHYKLNLEDIQMETRQAKRMFERSGISFESVEEFAEYLKPLQMAFSELVKAVRIGITLPVNTAGCERSFSKLKIIKNHLRTTMADSRIKSLAVISVHRRRALSIDLDEVVDRFIQKFPNTRIALV